MAANLARELTDTMQKCDQIQVKMQELQDELAETAAGAAVMRDALTEALSLIDASNDCPCPECLEEGEYGGALRLPFA